MIPLGSTVRVLEKCINAFYQGDTGVVINKTKWNMYRVEIFKGGNRYTPLIMYGDLEIIKPESEAAS